MKLRWCGIVCVILTVFNDGNYGKKISTFIEQKIAIIFDKFSLIIKNVSKKLNVLYCLCN